MAGGPYRTTNGWQVKWRIAGVWQSETFALQYEAEYFKHLVEEAGNRWPPGWIKGYGFPSERHGAPHGTRGRERS